MSDETLEDMAEGPRYAESILQTHKPVHPGPGRTRCPVCDAWYPCDLVSLAARVMLDRADLAASREREQRVAAALTGLVEAIRSDRSYGDQWSWSQLKQAMTSADAALAAAAPAAVAREPRGERV